MLEIAEREAIATSVGCPSSCHELLAVPAHSPQGSGWVAASCLWRVEACQVRVGSYGAGDRLEPGGQLPLSSAVWCLDSFQRRAWDRGLIARAFVQAFALSVSLHLSGLLAVPLAVCVH